MTSVTVQVPSPLPSSVEGGQATAAPFGSVTVQVTEPVGVAPAPVTVAVKVRVPPVAKPEALSATTVELVASPTEAVSSPELPV